MTKTSDIVLALLNQFKKIFPDIEYWYVENVPEGLSRPSFLFYPSFDERKKQSYMTCKVKTVIQVVYFGTNDGYSPTDYSENDMIINKARECLDKYSLKVGNRVLKFNYSVSKSDENTMFTIMFDFVDSTNNDYSKEQQADKAGQIIYKTRS